MSVLLLGCLPRQNHANNNINGFENQITLLSSFDPDQEIDYTNEGLTNTENEGAFFDFDEEKITSSESADIYLFVGCGTDCFNRVLEINGSRAAVVGLVKPGYEECRKAIELGKYQWINNVPGAYSCLETNKGNIVQILSIENKAHYQNAKVILDYTIWYITP